MPTKQIAIILTSVLLGGSGCVAAPVSNLTPEQAASSLAFSVGTQIVVQPTVLGVGGIAAGWLGAQEEERLLTLTQWSAGQKVGLDWSIATQVETVESVAARQTYGQTYASSPVGTEIPPEPETAYEEKLVSGKMTSASLESANTLGLPESWSEGDGGISSTSLIWLASSHYEELVNTRSTVVSLGLFDESLLKVENVTSQVTSMIDGISELFAPLLGIAKEELVESSSTESLLMLVADPQWGEYTLLVDGISTKVRVVEAKNAFASYKILANPDNPLILEIQLTPLSQGNLELLSAQGLAEGFGGYEVTQVNREIVE